jgi:hypothetical protein
MRGRVAAVGILCSGCGTSEPGYSLNVGGDEGGAPQRAPRTPPPQTRASASPPPWPSIRRDP